MKRFLCIAVLAAGLVGCTNHVGRESFKVTVYSGGTAVREFTASSVAPGSGSWHCTDATTGKRFSVCGSVVVEEL